jgi:hypothetical protein
MTSELDGCVVTFDEIRDELIEIERKLAQRLGIRKQIRRTLIEMIRSGSLVEDEVVAQWHSTYAIYLDWTQSDCYEDTPIRGSTSPPPAETTMQQEAAQAASWLLWFRNRLPCV